MANLFNIGGGSSNSQLDQLVAAYRSTQQPQVTRLEQQKAKLEKSSSYYNNLNSRLNSIITQLDKFDTDDVEDKFTTKKVSSSASEYATASANGEAVDGVNTLKVKRLASADMLISSQLNSTDNFNLSGSKVIEFIVNGENKTVTVDFDGTETNSEALAKIVKSVNETEDLGIIAGNVNDTTSTSRITFRSNNTGEDYNINFVDSEVFTALGINQADLNPNSSARTLSTSTSAGFKVSNQIELSSYSIVNGVDVRRNSNTLSDVLDGLTINLLKVQSEDDSEITLNTSVNNESVESFIQPFLDSYNNLIKFLSSDREQLRSDSAVSSLRFNLRSILTQEITTAKDGNPKYLANIGIDISSDGTLSIDDSELMEKLLAEDPSKIADIFLSEDGIISKVKTNVDRLKGEDDLMKTRTLDIANQINTQNERIEQLKSRIDRQAETQRKQYTRILESYYEAQSQYNSFNSFLQSSNASLY